MKTIINWHLPIKTASEGNSRENHFAKWRRHEDQKDRIKKHFLSEKPKIKLPCTCVLTRIAPRMLDEHDNLPMAFKFITDQLAALIIGNDVPGRADSDKRIKWEFKQKKGKTKEYAINVEISFDS